MGIAPRGGRAGMSRCVGGYCGNDVKALLVEGAFGKSTRELSARGNESVRDIICAIGLLSWYRQMQKTRVSDDGMDWRAPESLSYRARNFCQEVVEAPSR